MIEEGKKKNVSDKPSLFCNRLGPKTIAKLLGVILFTLLFSLTNEQNRINSLTKFLFATGNPAIIRGIKDNFSSSLFFTSFMGR